MGIAEVNTHYICVACNRQFLESYSRRGYTDEIKKQGLTMYVNGLGFRALERQTGVNHNIVIQWVKKAAKPLADLSEYSHFPEVSQVDELQTFVGKKRKFGYGQPLTKALREF